MHITSVGLTCMQIYKFTGEKIYRIDLTYLSFATKTQ